MKKANKLKERILLLLLFIFCFQSGKAQDLLIEKCKSDKDPNKCSTKRITKILSNSYRLPQDHYCLVNFSINKKGKLSDYITLVAVAEYEEIHSGIKKIAKELDSSSFNKNYTLSLYVDRKSNVHLRDTIPVHAKMGSNKFSKFLKENFKIHEDLTKKGLIYSFFLEFDIDTNQYIIDGSEKLLKLGETDYRVSEAALDLIPKLKQLEWVPKSYNGKYLKSTYRILYTFGEKSDGYSMYESIDLIGGVGPYYDEGVVLFLNKQYENAIEKFSKAIYINPSHLDALYNRGISYFNIGKIEEACKDWRKAASFGDSECLKLLELKCK